MQIIASVHPFLRHFVFFVAIGWWDMASENDWPQETQKDTKKVTGRQYSNRIGLQSIGSGLGHAVRPCDRSR
jgi:hypothetical protein